VISEPTLAETVALLVFDPQTGERSTATEASLVEILGPIGAALLIELLDEGSDTLEERAPRFGQQREPVVVVSGPRPDNAVLATAFDHAARARKSLSLTSAINGLGSVVRLPDRFADAGLTEPGRRPADARLTPLGLEIARAARAPLDRHLVRGATDDTATTRTHTLSSLVTAGHLWELVRALADRNPVLATDETGGDDASTLPPGFGPQRQLVLRRLRELGSPFVG
jgi:hypothetical protein